MLTLYYKQTCPYSQRVLGVVEEMGIKMNLKDVRDDPVAATELLEKGGKRQVPFFVDEDRDVSMYESNDIIKYLQEHYSKETQNSEHEGLHIHNDGDVCETCQ